MIQKPVCPKCACYFYPKKNGTPYLEMKPRGNGAPRGHDAPEMWEPYKLWLGDLWACQVCGFEIIIGALHPACEDYRPEFETMIDSFNPQIKVNDC